MRPGRKQLPLRDDLLRPIPGENPAGQNLRYDRISDQIREARTEDDDTLPVGEWERGRKKADFVLVVKLAGEALATKSKDLQLAAWLTEALFAREGIPVLALCLRLFLEMQEAFWDTLYPEIDEGDVTLRAAPVEWMASRVAALMRKVPITQNRLTYLQYRESRMVGYEADAAASDVKQHARQQAIDDGKLTAEEFDNGSAGTPKAFYTDLQASFDASHAALEELDEFNESRYGDDKPSLAKLKGAIDEVRQVVAQLLNEKRKSEPDPAPQMEKEDEIPPFPQVSIEDKAVTTEVPAPIASAPSPAAGSTVQIQSLEPQDEADAARRILSCARFYFAESASSSIPYLLCTAVRWGELRNQGGAPSLDFMEAPSTELRQKVKRLASDSNWDELIEASMEALASPCGRVWLDLHRYIWQASRQNGYSAIAASVKSSVLSILREFPELPIWVLNDDTPVANPETQRWLKEEVVPKPEEGAPQVADKTPVKLAAPAEPADGDNPTVFDRAMDMLRQGKAKQAVETVMRDAAQQASGRLRFLRRIEVAQLCLAAGQAAVAYPVLKELAEEIERRGLENWESSDVLAKPLSLLLQCLEQRENSAVDREEIFARLCRIDPTAAINNSR
jgi:type VI secretion system protein ImpA